MDQSPSYFAFPLNASGRKEVSAYWRGGFTLDDLDKIQALGEAAGKQEALVGGGAVNPRIRKGSVAWIPVADESTWLYERVVRIMQDLNVKYFGYDLWGFVGGLQYTVYEGSESPEYYDWHIDMNTDQVQRKLSFVLQLSNPMDYEGGELRLRGMSDLVVPKEQGIVYVFPSFILHQVTPVTKGVRKTLVAWAVGPDFR